MSALSSAADHVQLGPLPTLRSICPTGALIVRQLEKRLHRFNSAARGQFAFRFHKMGLCGSRKASECQNPLRVESKMADDAQIFNIRTPISLKQLKLENSNLVRTLPIGSTINKCKTRSQGSKSRSRGYIFNLRIAVNISETAKTTNLLFSV